MSKEQLIELTNSLAVIHNDLTSGKEDILSPDEIEEILEQLEASKKEKIITL